MLETELNDRENSSEGHGNTDPAGVAATPAGTGTPAGGGPDGGATRPASPGGGSQAASPEGGSQAASPDGGPQAASPDGSAAAPAARKATGRTRRAVTRAAGPPAAGAADAAVSAQSPDVTTTSVPPVTQVPNAAATRVAPVTQAPKAARVPAVTQVPIAAAEPPAAASAARGAVPAAMAPAIAVPMTAVPTTVVPPNAVPAATFQPPPVIFQPPAAGEPAGGGRQRDETSDGDTDGPARDRSGSSRRRTTRGQGADADSGEGQGAHAADASADQHAATGSASAAADDQETETDASGRRRRRRGSRSRGRGDGDTSGADDAAAADAGGAAAESGQARGGRRRPADADANAADGGPAGEPTETDGDDQDGEDGPGGTRRRRRKRRRGSTADADQPTSDDPPNTVVHVRPPRAHGSEDSAPSSDVQSVRGSTRLEAKRQRRREGRESGRRRPPVITESEFLARREAVDRVMVVRQRGERTQIAVLEDGVLVEHYVDKSSHQSFVGNVYLGKVQNVLPSMEAAFVDIGKGRNAVLYAGEVNFDASGLEGESKRIESALKSGQSVLVQVTKDPVGHKGARLTSQVSLPGRYLVYVPGASMMGISRKLPDKERTRLKHILKQVMPAGAGVIVRTAAEGAAEEELAHDVARLSAQWESIERKSKTASAPELLYSEPDLTIRVVRDIFNEDFSTLVVAGDEGWDLVDEYVRYVAPHLADRLVRWDDDEEEDAFARYRIDEQLAKALERKVWLPSGGSLVIDNTEAMTVVDVNTGKFTGKGGNLEETVTKNNLEAAEEMVRQLRLRDIGGIIVIDFIDMVLESNRDLVLRRLLECLARDRTKHQVAEVTSLGLVQMTRKRVGSGLLEAFSEPCECCNGRGRIVSLELTEHAPEGQRGRGARTDGRQPRDGRQARGGRQERNGKVPEQGDAEPAPSGPAAAAGAEAPEADIREADLPGAGQAAPAETGRDVSGPDGPAAAAPLAPDESGAGASQGGGRRRRRSASREQGPPDQPTLDQASLDQASLDQASLDQASLDQASLDQPSMDQPTPDQASWDQPSLSQPPVGQPSVGQPPVDQPALDRAAADQAGPGAASNGPDPATAGEAVAGSAGDSAVG
jgi:ribonuclease E